MGQVIALSLTFLGFAAGAAEWRFGSIRAGQAWVAGKQLFVENSQFEMVYYPSDSVKDLKFEIHNLATEPIAIYGYDRSCSCTIIEDLPDVIPVGGTVVVRARVGVSQSSADVQNDGFIRIFTGDRTQPDLTFRYRMIPAEPIASHISKHN